VASFEIDHPTSLELPLFTSTVPAGFPSPADDHIEDKTCRAPRSARQFIGDAEVTDLDAGVDLHGRGGLVMSAKDLAILAAALLEGRLFERPGTIQEMLWQGVKGQSGIAWRLFDKVSDRFQKSIILSDK
jgi:hypothetical protein